MQISKDTVIRKMLQEMEGARQSKSDKEIAVAMGHIKLLSELWLEEYQKNTDSGQQITPLKPTSSSSHPMDSQPISLETDQQILASARNNINKESDDMSIFDF